VGLKRSLRFLGITTVTVTLVAFLMVAPVGADNQEEMPKPDGGFIRRFQRSRVQEAKATRETESGLPDEEKVTTYIPKDDARALPFTDAILSDPYNAAHILSVRASIWSVASLLQDVLSRKLTAFIAGVKDAKSVTRWANAEVIDVRQTEVEQRLRTTYQIVVLLLLCESPSTVRAWFIGTNPHLNDQSPASAIRDDHLKEVLNAARAFYANG
jgi:hypothetical protein